MNILYITVGYLPYTFSESLCNGKLVYALQRQGIDIDVISRTYDSSLYSNDWTEPWALLKEHTHEVKYNHGNRLVRFFDTLRASAYFSIYPIDGLRWAYYAYMEAIRLSKSKHYDIIMTRSPSDIPHLVGYKLKQTLGIPWIANWNDPSATIWPKPYSHQFSVIKKWQLNHLTDKYLDSTDVNTFPSQWLLDHFMKSNPNLKNKNNIVIPHIALDESIELKPSQPMDCGKFRMCHSGNLSAERNPELTFRAIRQLIDEGRDKMEFHIMGYVNNYTQKLIDKYNLNAYVKCIGGFPYMDAMWKMQEYDCLVLLEAILEKGIFFPSKLTDYAQMNRPILAISPTDGYAVENIDKSGIVVDNKDVNSIKHGIASLYDAWMDGVLSSKYDSTELYKIYRAQNVVERYKQLLSQYCRW